MTSARAPTSTSVPARTTTEADVDADDGDDDDGDEGQGQTGKGGISEGHAEKDSGETTKTTPMPDKTVKKEEEKDEEEEEEEEVDLFELYSGCFIPESRSKRGDRREFLYTPGANTCPTVTASRVTWPETRHGNTRSAPCKNGKGELYFVSFVFV